MRIVIAMFVCLGLIGLECSAHAEPHEFADTTAFTPFHATAFTSGSAITGTGTGGGSVRGMIRQRCLALLSFLGRHVEHSIKSERAATIHLTGQPHPGLSLSDHGRPTDPEQVRLTGLTDRLMRVEASFALGNGKLSSKRPIRLGVSASPHRLRMVAKVRF